MHKLQESLFNWYNLKYNQQIKRELSTLALFFFNTHQLIMTIILGTILCVIWLFSPFIFITEFSIAMVHSLSQKTAYKKLLLNEPGILIDKYKVILDLDNTLIFSTMQKLENKRSFLQIEDKLIVYKRPHLDTFLSTLSEFCDLAIYTSSTQEYADKILRFIDKNQIIKDKFYRHNCVLLNNILYKDVLKLKYNPKTMLIIDDNPKCYLNMKENIIQIKLWKGDERDDSLLKIKNIFRNYYKSGNFNVKDILRSTWTNEV